MDLIAQGIIIENFIEPSLDLLETFNTYWSLVMPVGSKTTMAHPFPRLQTDGFWHRIATAG
jgi:predicted restriction endonuclease